ncbi:hypothetical protein UGMREWDR_CDS0192 [Aeromonas phage GomatiRiver_11]|nr:hypothetical protein UGMREWDR_CDS0192 [Aeromonas phage GomatiRiver_11]
MVIGVVIRTLARVSNPSWYPLPSRLPDNKYLVSYFKVPVRDPFPDFAIFPRLCKRLKLEAMGGFEPPIFGI